MRRPPLLIVVEVSFGVSAAFFAGTSLFARGVIFLCAFKKEVVFRLWPGSKFTSAVCALRSTGCRFIINDVSDTGDYSTVFFFPIGTTVDFSSLVLPPLLVTLMPETFLDLLVFCYAVFFVDFVS